MGSTERNLNTHERLRVKGPINCFVCVIISTIKNIPDIGLFICILTREDNPKRRHLSYMGLYP